MNHVSQFSGIVRVLLCALVWSIGAGAAWAADVLAVNAKPVEMEPVLVSTIFTSIKLRPFLRETAPGGRQVIALLRIEEVRKKSPAERAGLLPGYEVVAINGVKVRGLDEGELDKLWRGPFFDDVLVLRVAPIRPGQTLQAYDIRIPLKKDPPMAVGFSFGIGEPGSPGEKAAGQGQAAR